VNDYVSIFGELAARYSPGEAISERRLEADQPPDASLLFSAHLDGTDRVSLSAAMSPSSSGHTRMPRSPHSLRRAPRLTVRHHPFRALGATADIGEKKISGIEEVGRGRGVGFWVLSPRPGDRLWIGAEVGTTSACRNQLRYQRKPRYGRGLNRRRSDPNVVSFP